MEGISIVDKDSNIEIRVFPDELPLSAAEVTDELLSLFAPLPTWRNTAASECILLSFIEFPNCHIAIYMNRSNTFDRVCTTNSDLYCQPL